MRQDLAALVRYALTGVANVSSNFGVFWVLYEVVGVWYVLASVAGYAVRTLIKFLSLRFWVYGGARDGKHHVFFGQFIAVEAGLYLLTLPVLVLLVEIAGLSPVTATALIIAGLYGIGFLSMRRIFSSRSDSLVG